MYKRNDANFLARLAQLQRGDWLVVRDGFGRGITINVFQFEERNKAGIRARRLQRNGLSVSMYSLPTNWIQAVTTNKAKALGERGRLRTDLIHQDSYQETATC